MALLGGAATFSGAIAYAFEQRTLVVLGVPSSRRRATISSQDIRIEVNDPSLMDDLLLYLSRCQCELTKVDERSVDVAAPALHDTALAAIQLSGFLRTWCVRHPQAAMSGDHHRVALSAHEAEVGC